MKGFLFVVLLWWHDTQDKKITEIVQVSEKKGVVLPLDDEISDAWLEDFLYPEKKQENSGRYLMDFYYLHKELGRPNVTLTLLHDEYVQYAKNSGKIPYA